MQSQWTHKAGIFSSDNSLESRHQLPSIPEFIQTLRASAAKSTGTAGHLGVPKEPEQPTLPTPYPHPTPASQIGSLSPAGGAPRASQDQCHTHLPPRSPGVGGSRERWARGPLGGAGARGSPCPRAGGEVAGLQRRREGYATGAIGGSE